MNNIQALVQIMAWCRPGDKPLSEPMMVSLLTHVCVTRSQWLEQWWPNSLTPICVTRPQCGTFLLSWIHLNPSMICNYTPNKMLDEIMSIHKHPLLKFGMDRSFYSTLYWSCDYLSMSALKLIHAERPYTCICVLSCRMLPISMRVTQNYIT